MSTSLETSPKASPSNNAVRTAPLLAVAFVCGLLGGVYLKTIFPALLAVPQRRARQAATSWLVEQAKLWPMTYETAEPGKPVVWCVDHLSKDVSYLDGKPSQPLIWTNEAVVPLSHGPTSGGSCERFLARVVERRPNVVVLEFLGRP